MAAVRRILGPDRIIGLSVGNDAEALEASGADYVGIGPVYATALKDDAGDAIGVAELERLAALCARPAVGVGGIDASNAAAVIAVGARGVAVIGALFSASDPEAAARSLRSAIWKVMSGAPTAADASRRSGRAICGEFAALNVSMISPTPARSGTGR